MTARVRPVSRRGRAADELERAAGALVAAALVFTPWCWGCAWPSGIHLLDLLLLAATMLWLPGFALRRVRLPFALLLGVTAILLQGWLMTLNSRSLYAETTGLFAPLDQPVAWLPGSRERDLSWEMMARVTGLLGAALIVATLGRRRIWREGFLVILIATAASIVLFGCAQRWGGAADIFWGPRRLDYFFASYRNVTNAGEYLNLALPLAAAAAWIARGRSAILHAGAVCVFVLLIVGSCICGSKAAPLLGLGLAFAFLVTQRGEARWSTVHWRSGMMIAVILIASIVLTAWGAGWSVSQDRWQRLFAPAGDVTLGNRLLVDRAGAAGLPHAGWLGDGPGTFPVVFPSLQAGLANAPSGRWLAAHDDYLQTALEWGVMGVVSWSVYLFGAPVLLLAGLRRGEWRRDDRTMARGLVLALAGVVLMAFIDFPMQVASIELDLAVLCGLGWSSGAWSRIRDDESHKKTRKKEREKIVRQGETQAPFIT